MALDVFLGVVQTVLKTFFKYKPYVVQSNLYLTASQGKHKEWLLKAGGCLTGGGEYQYKINVWEHLVWLLQTGWLLNRGDR